jgi:hypothetical protein
MVKPRRVKRLALRYDSARQRESGAALGAEADQWRQRGIQDVSEIVEAFDIAARLRVRFEDQLQRPAYLSREGRRVKRVLLEAIEIMHAAGISDVEAGLRHYVKKYFLDTLPEHPPKRRRPPGQPEETWMRSPALVLFALWREAGHAWPTTLKDVSRAFALAGHADVVTEASLRRLAREATPQKLARMLALSRAARAGGLDRLL